MRKVGSPARRYAIGSGAGIDAHAKRGAVPKQQTTSSQAAQRARGAFDASVVRPRLHRRLTKLMAGRARVVVRGANGSEPAFVIAVDDNRGRP